jgi:poly(A) polymerase
MTERDFATDVVRTLQRAGFRALWAGGCVRDELLGLAPHDYDVATDARPEQVIRLFRRSLAVGAAFGVIEVVGPRGPHREHLTVEVATFRSDGAYSDGRRPDTVTFSSPEEDARRRDFTINGMFFDPLNGEFHDFVGGRADLAAKVLRAIGNPAERFAEDKLRILRAVRIAARFGLDVEPDTLAAARRMAAEIRVVSAERIADELRKMLTHPNRGRGVRLLREFALVGPVLPELLPAFTLPHNSGALWDHIVRVVDALGEGHTVSRDPESAEGSASASPSPATRPPVSFPLAFAALLPHVGKDVAEAVADRLRLSNAEKGRVAWLVERRDALADAPTMRASKLNPLLVHPGIGELLALHRADAVAAGRDAEHVALCERVLRDTPPDELNPPPVLTGTDLLAMGLKPGPDFKRWLDAVRDAHLDGDVTTRDEAVEWVRRMT